MRYYDIDGMKLPSVTSLLPPPFLVQWSANCAVEHILNADLCLRHDDWVLLMEEAKTAWRVVSEKAKNIGIEVHEHISTFLNTGKLVESEAPEVANCMKAFTQFLFDCDSYKTISTEEVVNTDRWAGTRDVVMDIKWKGLDDTFVIDWKTSKSLYMDNRIQVTAYASVGGYRPALLRLDKEGKGYEFKTWSDKLSRKYMRIFEAYVKHYYDLLEAKGGK